MESFEALDLTPELVDALAAEGMEIPTPLQEAVIPVLRRGNNLVVVAGPGSGIMAAWAAPLLERLSPEEDGLRLLVLTATRDVADALAESTGRLATATGHRVAALGSPWSLPGKAHVLFGTPADVLAAGRAGDVSLSTVAALVVDGAHYFESVTGLGAVEEVMEFLPSDAQRVLCALPYTETLQDFASRHLKRATVVPPQRVGGTDDSVTPRGKVGLHIATGHPEETVLATVAGLLEGDARHVLLFCRTDDRAADLGDYLTLHGYMAGAPGDTDVPVWLAVEELEAREAAEGVPGVVPVSADVPADPDSLDRRHGRSEAGEVIVLPREVEHFRNIAFRTGYTLARRAAPAPSRAVDEVAALRDAIERAVTEEDIAPYFLVLEPLFAKHDPMAVAAAATALFRRKAPVAATGTSTSSGASERDPAAGPAQQAWVRVFLGVGSRDEITPRDLVGAIAGESGIRGNQVGKIEIRDTVTIVEIEQSVAEKVIRAVNGTTIKGRSVRADYDRPRGREPRDGGGKRSGPPPRKKDPRGPR